MNQVIRIRSVNWEKLWAEQKLRHECDLKARLLDRSVEEPGPLDTPCLVWTGARTSQGYGNIAVERVNYLAHRLAHELVVGPIPEGLQVQHLCNNRLCIRIEHLVLGDALQNNLYKLECGRQGDTSNPGSRNGRASINEEMVVEILRQINKGFPYVEIAREFGVDRSLISRIARGISWTHVSGIRPAFKNTVRPLNQLPTEGDK
jgi:hypothetical protein